MTAAAERFGRWEERLVLALVVASGVALLWAALRGYGWLGASAAGLWLGGVAVLLRAARRRFGWVGLILGTVSGGLLMFAMLAVARLGE